MVIIMAKKLSLAASTIMLLATLLLHSLQPLEANIGVCYGMVADNLPSKEEVINLYHSNAIQAMRIYSPDESTLQALQGSNIDLILGVPNQILQSLGSDQSSADEWVRTNVSPYSSTSIKVISVGNEIHSSDQTAPYVVPAMQNILNSLNSQQLGGQIKVSTSIDLSLITNSYPPSSGQFSEISFMSPIVDFLNNNDFPLLVNVYPYFAYIYNKNNIDLDYALASPSYTSLVDDYNNGLQYQTLFDAQVDSVYAALEKVGAPDVKIVVSETGWPSEGGDSATMENARAYYSNLIDRVRKGMGTPMKPEQPVECYLFAMFDEYQKPGAETERHFGLFTPDKQAKYQLSFSN